MDSTSHGENAPDPGRPVTTSTTLEALGANPVFPLRGEFERKELQAPVIPEPRRTGEEGEGCPVCAKSDAEFLWTSCRWRLSSHVDFGLAGVVLLATRAHVDGLHDMDGETLRELGPMLARVEAAIMATGRFARVHLDKTGDGVAHFHVWLLPRPLGALQLRGSFLKVWGVSLPALDREVLDAVFDEIAVNMGAGD